MRHLTIWVGVRSWVAERGRASRTVPWGDFLVVLSWALGLRLIFAVLTADTYDPDEFVILHLSHDFSSGAVPYRDFMFFHPPGMLVLFRELQPLIGWWWPIGRLVMVLVDSLTAVLVWRLGCTLYGRKEALAAGLLYGAHPLALICGVRVVQDPIITALGVAGLLVLMSKRTWKGAVLAGICVGLAFWVKYPAILFLPIYALAAPRRTLVCELVFLGTVCALFAPFLPEWHALFSQTVLWQLMHRVPSDMGARIGSLAAFWLLVNPLVAPAALRYRPPVWLAGGFVIAALFVFASQVYYHYFVPVIPFAALITAPLIARLVSQAPKRLGAAAVGVVLVWAADIDVGAEPLRLFVTATHLSAITRTVQLIDSITGPGQQILTDHFEYAYLANRVAVNYFWNMSGVVRASTLERHMGDARIVVMTQRVAPTYPQGFADFLQDRRYRQVRAGATDLWISSSFGGHSSSGSGRSARTTARITYLCQLTAESTPTHHRLWPAAPTTLAARNRASPVVVQCG